MASSVQAYVIPCPAMTNPGAHISSVSTRLSAGLNGWGAQKLGQTVISQNVSASVVDTSSILRFTPGVGSGLDERVDKTKLQNLRGIGTSDLPALSKLDTYFKKQSLLLSLTSPALGVGEKLERISFAAHVEGLLPTSIAPSNSICSSTVKSGGLMSDWNF